MAVKGDLHTHLENTIFKKCKRLKRGVRVLKQKVQRHGNQR